MKVIFLDIDGVLNNAGDFIEVRKYGHPHNKGNQIINRACLAILQTLVECTSAKIVFSTAWRRDYDLDAFHEMFKVRGWELERDVMVGYTPVIWRDNKYRGEEIRRYLNEHSEVENFVILDDNTDSIEEEGFTRVVPGKYDTTGDFIETNPNSGLTPTQGLHASWALGLNKQAMDDEEQYRKDLDLLAYSMI